MEPASFNISKRIIVCCDGTWHDGILDKRSWQHSNVLKLSRTLKHEDRRHNPPIPQIVFYQRGIGSEKNLYAEYVEGATGASLAEKVEEAYAFIAQNFQTGDEIHLFGFSRGAYTVRMVAAYIGEIGVLDKKDMDYFADIFIAYQKRAKATDAKGKIEECDRVLKLFNEPCAKGRARLNANLDNFTIKAIGVWDTVGTYGLPEELKFSKKVKNLFSFPDRILGTHINYAFHAMALNETRADFNVTKFEQTQEGRKKGQVLKQVWFAGSHSDVGGGWQQHDLSDIALAWMVSNIENLLSIDVDYLRGLPRPSAPWGTQTPHDPQTGVFKLSRSMQRDIPKKTNDVTNEKIHPSVMHQSLKPPLVEEYVMENPSLLDILHQLEELIKQEWPFMSRKFVTSDKETNLERASQASEKRKLLEMAKHNSV